MNPHIDERYTAILTTHNAHSTVARAVKGILNQNIPPKQIIVVDDCSIDQTLEIVKDLLGHLEIAHIHRNPQNKGQSWSRNFAANMTDFDLMIYFDDDDFSHSKRAEEHLRLFSLGAHLNYVSSKKIYPNGYTTLMLNQDALLERITTHDALLSILTGSTIQGIAPLSVPSSTLAMSKAAHQVLGGFNIEFRRLEDADLFVRSADKRFAIGWSSTLLVDRYASNSAGKGGAIEMQYESKLLKEHSHCLPLKESIRAANQIKMRRLYFERKYFRMLLFVLQYPYEWRVFASKTTSFLRRVIHDCRKGT
jgi:glycosyltransferase involved in cell wall biosynthesis